MKCPYCNQEIAPSVIRKEVARLNGKANAAKNLDKLRAMAKEANAKRWKKTPLP
jgi:hypothetical protein